MCIRDSIFTQKFVKSPNDIKLLKRILKVMDKKECTENNLFFEVSSKLYELEPSALAASKMGKMSISRNEYNQAINYFKERRGFYLTTQSAWDKLFPIQYGRIFSSNFRPSTVS